MRKKGWRGNTRPATDVGELVGHKVKGNIPEMPNTMFVAVIHRVPDGNNIQTFSNQVQSSYTGVRHWEEIIAFIEKYCCTKEPYHLTALYKFNLTQEELDEDHMGLYAPGPMINVPLYC